MEEIDSRIQRLYEAVGTVTDAAILNYPVGTFSIPGWRGFGQDFSGGASQAELSNTLHTLIYNVANLHDHLKRWVSKSGGRKDDVHDFLFANDEFLVVTDLANNDKHGLPRDGGHSGKTPRLANVKAAARLTSTSEKGASLMIGAEGMSVAGKVERIITADVYDGNGNRLGDANHILTKAVAHCEAALAQFHTR